MASEPREASWTAPALWRFSSTNPQAGRKKLLVAGRAKNEVKAACRVEATCLVKVKRRREHRRKLTPSNFPRKLRSWRKRLLLKTVGLDRPVSQDAQQRACDWHASHYVKVMLDQIFANRFVAN
jgi:hypothetical protein